jgi:leucyl aminopeptidase
MKVSSYASDFLDIADAAAVLFCSKAKKPTGEILEKIDLLTDGAVSEMFRTGEFDGSSGSEVMLHRVPETAAGRVILVGLGEENEIDLDSYRQAAGRVGKLALSHHLKSVGMYYDGPDLGNMAAALTEGIILGSYQFLRYKTNEKATAGTLASASVVVSKPARVRSAEKGIAQAQIITDAAIMARDLAAIPGNDLYPEEFARFARKVARQYGLQCTVLGPAEIHKERMGALEAVGRGSARPPQFVIVRHNGKPAAKPVVLIGKGITFDSGGISLKPSADMDQMKWDMSGAADVLATVVAAARLKAKVNLIGLLPLAENMPSSKASRPGDIIVSRSGLTVEIISTDAEGRLILADALDYADKFKPQAVIDIATLTGAALYILGYAGAPFVGTHPGLNDGLRAAAARTGERIWELPLWKDFVEQMKSPLADLKNSGGRAAGTLAAASFLRKFVKEWPWAHIDIAYCALEISGKPYVPKGTTGFGVRLLVDLIRHWKSLT